MEIFSKVKTFIIKHNLIDFKTRNHKLSIVNMFINFLVAAFKIIAAFYISSYFLIVSSIYTATIGFTKQIFFKGVTETKEDGNKERRYVIFIYLILLFAAITYSGYMIRLFFISEDEFNYGLIISLGIAVVSFVEIIIAIIGLVKSNHLRDRLLTAYKTVTFSSALVAIVVTQSVLLNVVDMREGIYQDHNLSNGILGLIMGVSTIIFTSVLLIRTLRIRRKPLEELTLEELWELFPISLEPHKDRWFRKFEFEKNYLLTHLSQDKIEMIEHVGSTAIPTIYAKNIIDILIVVKNEYDMHDIAEYLSTIGYIIMSRKTNRVSLNKGYTRHGFAKDVFHLHLRYPGDQDELLFRDYLIHHADAALDYENLKLRLSIQYKHNRDAYTEAKTAFVKDIIKKAKKEKK